VYLQVQTWLGNNMNPMNWGWQANKYGSLVPMSTPDEPAPQSLLTTIYCKCTKGCNAACSCRKALIKCSKICANCKGHSCTNSPTECDTENVDDAEQMLLVCGDSVEEEIYMPADDATIHSEIRRIRTIFLKLHLYFYLFNL
jgi:hypothetical protein